MFNNNKQRQFFVGAEKVNDLEISRKLLTDIAVLLNVISEKRYTRHTQGDIFVKYPSLNTQMGFIKWPMKESDILTEL